ncbi:hypothetical protein Nepgr_008733 [Nepenthes gracilis]|uniref:Tf2-1-like SH3-like domain-containing protein n=1 Tax=Nepenthes gracilis TaxID=150966 RepID=A0AAD3S9G7_NEPGR|nr:hypothetical protein Nepgr_008733 [Nepenthes gracilis]
MALRKHTKLASKDYCAFAIIATVGRVAYTLQLPPESKIYPTFHVSYSKKCISTQKQVQPRLPAIADTDKFIIPHQQEFQSTTITRKNCPITLLLRKWTYFDSKKIRHGMMNPSLTNLLRTTTFIIQSLGRGSTPLGVIVTAKHYNRLHRLPQLSTYNITKRRQATKLTDCDAATTEA